MKKLILAIPTCILAIVSILFYSAGTATGSSGGSVLTVIDHSVQQQIKNVYQGIDFGEDSLSPDAFEKGYYGYLNLKAAGKLTNENVLTVCDFSKSANEYRLWIIDLPNKKVLFHTLVAHGQGSGEEFATAFSDRNNSHQSSLGFYVTGETYDGQHGLSLRLNGMDKGFNSSALDRGVVVHGANYVCNEYIQGNKRLGRSWGCPAVPAEMSNKIINTIKNGTCLFIYYPASNYLSKSVWLKKNIHIEDVSFPMMGSENIADIMMLRKQAPDEEREKPMVLPADSFKRNIF